MPQINILIKKGEKGQAKTLIEKTILQVEQIEADLQRLAQMSEIKDEELPSLIQLKETKQYLTNKANQLRYTLVYITCAANLFDGDYSTFCEEINSALTDFDVSFVDEKVTTIRTTIKLRRKPTNILSPN